MHMMLYAYITVVYLMIKNMLTGRKESDTYLAAVSRPLESADHDENR